MVGLSLIGVVMKIFGQALDIVPDATRFEIAHLPPGEIAAGELIDRCGLRGFRIGTAEVSMKHANFIQADPGGRASDVIAVMDHVKKVVQQECGYDLRSEVRLIESKKETA